MEGMQSTGILGEATTTQCDLCCEAHTRRNTTVYILVTRRSHYSFDIMEASTIQEMYDTVAPRLATHLAHIGANQFVALMALYKRKGWNNVLAPVEVRDAGAKGRGVFATRDIKKGEVVTMYPAHAVGIDHYEKRGNTTWEMSLPNMGDHIVDYIWTVKKGINIAGAKYVTYPATCGHIINYAASVDLVKEILAKGSGGKRSKQYAKDSTKGSNVKCEFQHNVAAIRASKDIARGDELLISYGALYWENAHRDLFGRKDFLMV